MFKFEGCYVCLSFLSICLNVYMFESLRVSMAKCLRSNLPKYESLSQSLDI
jgi:hypothetical protein